MYLTAEYCRQPTAWSITHQISCSLLYLLCCKTKLDNVTSNTAEEEVVEHWPPRPRTVSWPRKRPHANKRLPRIQRCIRTQTLSKGSSRKIINTPRHVLLSGKILSHFQSCFFVHVMLCSGGLLLNSFARRMETALESTHIHRRSQQARKAFTIGGRMGTLPLGTFSGWPISFIENHMILLENMDFGVVQ